MKSSSSKTEPKTGDYLKQGLTEAGFVVDLARDGLDGLHFALSEAYDLAILDVMLARASTAGRCSPAFAGRARKCRCSS